MGALRSFALIAVMAAPAAAIAQAITVDGTLNTSVGNVGNAYTITGGTVRGTNLFHSFGQFSVPASGSAVFDGPAATQNVLSRVTGGSLSTIEGVISTRAGTSPMPNANFYLINPAGVMFAPGSSVDVGGAFHASTADHIQLTDGVLFSAVPGPGDALLSSAPPLAFGFLGTNPAITADGTLGTVVTDLGGGAFAITDGTQRGNNIFHSFGLFSVPSGGAAVFDGPAVGADQIQNVISRVTGGQASNIDGAISTLAGGAPMPNASFFFINPAGVMFGPNAAIDVGGAFHVSTATDLRLADNILFSAMPGPGDTLLTAAQPQAFGFLSTFLGRSPAPIDLNGSQLFFFPALDPAGPGQTMSFIGGDVTLHGGAVLVAPGGLIRIVSVGSPGVVDLASPDLGLGSFATLGRVTISEGSAMSAGGVFFDTPVLGGSVVIRGGQLVIEGGAIVTTDTSDFGGAAVGIDLWARDSIVVRDASTVLSVSQPTGTSAASPIAISGGHLTVTGVGTTIESQGGQSSPPGAIDIEVASVNILDGAKIQTTSNVAGANITISASGTVTLAGAGSEIHAGGGSVSANLAGDISVVASNVVLQDSAQIRSGGGGEEAGQTLSVSATNTLSISSAAGISSEAFAQDVAALQISASQLVMDGGYINATTRGLGNAGQVLVNANTVSLVNGAQIASSSQEVAIGAGGSITINAPGSVTISGAGSGTGLGEVTLSRTASSGIFSTTEAPGAAGQITVSTPTLTLSNTARISVATKGAGNAGIVTANVGSLGISGGARIDSNTTAGGAGGAIAVNGVLSITGAGSGLFSTASSSGNAGAITVTAPTLMLGDGSRISVTTEAGGNAGTVLANVGTLDISGGARVDSSTTAAGAGGAITVNATGGASISGTDSGLFSTASSTGNAGQVTVSAPTLAVTNGGKISVVSTGAGDAGSVIATGTNVLVTTGGQIDSSSSGAGDGGAINIGALRVEITDGGSVKADSSGAGLTGNITIAAADRIIMNQGSISTLAESSDGGNITLTAPNVIRLQDSQITTSVESGVGGGGNVFIDPQFVIMDGSTITANAFGGPGGNITIVANNFVTDPTSFLSASSALSTPGTVRIESPDNNLASDIAQLPRELVDASRLLRGGCTARRTSAPSSFVVAGRGGVPADPDGYLPSFSASGGPYTGARGAAVNPGFALAMAGWDCWQ
jgi:filamentous hemagglutinin family protein